MLNCKLPNAFFSASKKSIFNAFTVNSKSLDLNGVASSNEKFKTNRHYIWYVNILEWTSGWCSFIIFIIFALDLLLANLYVIKIQIPNFRCKNFR